MSADGLGQAEAKMREAGQHEESIKSFAGAYERVTGGGSALLASADLEPAPDVPTFDGLPADETGDVLGRFAVIKLNGGLATTMGLRSPKSLVEVRGGRSFLDVIVGQTLELRRRHSAPLPLVLMNSQATRRETLEALERYPELPVEGLPLEFLQGMVPKLDADELAPVSWPKDPDLEWCPPGHGDVYGALRRSGALEALLERGIEFAMISNSDNLGATLDARIAAFVARERIPFLMEVVEGTPAERKGGHIARRRSDGNLVLRESAQTPEEDQESFRDYGHWRYYNTNNLWVDLRALAATLDGVGGVLELPLIVNHKTVDPRDPDSTPVIQLESAMGAAIGSFPGARLLCVPRTRFVPVKTTDDLLVLRSDVYTITSEMVVRPVPEREASLPFVELDKRFYRILEDFDARFPDGPPSLREADRLVVHGDVVFEAGVRVLGEVEIDAQAPMRIVSGTALGGSGSQ